MFLVGKLLLPQLQPHLSLTSQKSIRVPMPLFKVRLKSDFKLTPGNIFMVYLLEEIQLWWNIESQVSEKLSTHSDRTRAVSFTVSVNCTTLELNGLRPICPLEAFVLPVIGR